MSQKLYLDGIYLELFSCKLENNTPREENREEWKTGQAAQGKAEKQVKSIQCIQRRGNPEARELAIVK